MADSTATTDVQDTDATTATDAPSTGDATGTNGGNDGRTFTQADVDRIVNERIERERQRAERERQRAEEQAEAERLEAQQEFQQLAEQRLERISELEPVAERAERYEAALRTHLDREREGLPDHITTLLDRMDVAEQLEYIAANRDSLRPQAPRPGVPDTPAANGHLTDSEAIEAEIQRQRRTGRYAL